MRPILTSWNEGTTKAQDYSHLEGGLCGQGFQTAQGSVLVSCTSAIPALCFLRVELQDFPEEGLTNEGNFNLKSKQVETAEKNDSLQSSSPDT